MEESILGRKLFARGNIASWILQLNEHETFPYFLQFFQSNTTVCLIIYVICKSWEPETVLKKSKSYKTHNSTLSCIENSEKNIYGFFSHLFSCTRRTILFSHLFRSLQSLQKHENQIDSFLSKKCLITYFEIDFLLSIKVGQQLLALTEAILLNNEKLYLCPNSGVSAVIKGNDF